MYLNVPQIYFNLCFVVTKRSVIAEEISDVPQTPVNTEQYLESKTVDCICIILWRDKQGTVRIDEK